MRIWGISGSSTVFVLESELTWNNKSVIHICDIWNILGDMFAAKLFANNEKYVYKASEKHYVKQHRSTNKHIERVTDYTIDKNISGYNKKTIKAKWYSVIISVVGAIILTETVSFSNVYHTIIGPKHYL